MRTLTTWHVALTGAVLATMVACLDMDVVNVNNPDAARALGNPEDVEALLGSSFYRWWVGTQREGPPMTLSVAAEEFMSGNATWDGRPVSAFPRVAWPNNPGSPTTMDVLWREMYRAISQANDALTVRKSGVDFGPDGRNNLRAEAFGRFVQGIAHGWLALAFDRAFVVDEDVDPATEAIVLRPYPEVMDAAIAYLEESIRLSESGTFVLPETWIRGLPLTNDELARLAHSYIARFLPSVARDPEARARTNWSAVVDHANRGITSDFAPIGDGTATWFDYLKHYGYIQNRFRVNYMVIGPADTTGAYDAWYGGPPQDRVEFVMAGPDRRINAPDDPMAPGTDFYHYGPSNHPANHLPYRWGRYLPNRYDHIDRTGPMPAFLLAELDFLRAEAWLHLGDREQTAAIVNKTRVARGGLPPVASTDPYLMEKLIYEKRIELYASAGGVPFFDARGWGFLWEGTPVQFPIPALELELMGEPIYTFGRNNPSSAPPRSIHPVALTAEDLDLLRRQ